MTDAEEYEYNSEPVQQEYLVEWAIHVVATSPEDAARVALAIQQDPANAATVFEVTNAESGGTSVIDLGWMDDR
jgi:hypothetical protein